MPITITEAEYVDGIMNAANRYLIDHARWEGVPAGKVVRDIIERFITPKCYLIRPGTIADGPKVNIVIGISSRTDRRRRKRASFSFVRAMVCCKSLSSTGLRSG
jgi:hypothetical protein